ncbi:MAG: hypothetical protein ACTHLO_13225 [Pseudolabrys sp.]
MFVALKNWRERLKHQGTSGVRFLASAEHALIAGGDGSAALLRKFRATGLARGATRDKMPVRGELGPQFAEAEPLSLAQNMSIMTSVKRGAAQRARKAAQAD